MNRRSPYCLLVAGGALVALGGTAAVAGPVPFANRTADSGITFVHHNGSSGEKFAVELIGAGGAMLDFDSDGDLDLYFVQGAGLPGHEYDPPARNELWARVSEPGAPLRYESVAGAAGADDDTYGMGAAVADYDNDGDPDLYVTNFGANRLYRNDAGRFTDVTAAAGVGDPRWSTSAVFFDADGDGFPDLYVCNYFKYRIEDHEWYGLRKPGYRTHGGPASFRPEPDIFYRNRGDGTFEDATESAGFAAVTDAHALGAVAGDFDDDGDLDLYVANDTQPNWLFVNDGAGHFTEDGMLAGVSFDQGGTPQAGMGVDAQDANGDGRVDLFVTNFSLETNTLYVAEDGGYFTDGSFAAGLGEAALPYLAFGAGFFDPDLDGDLDLFVANGHIMDNVDLYFDNLDYAQPNQVFENDGTGHFAVGGKGWGDLVASVAVSRAAIFGDLDDDGDPDVVVTNVGAAPEILVNEAPRADRFVRLRLVGTRSPRDGGGAEVRARAGDRLWRRQVRTGSSYLAANDPRPVLGLGDVAALDRLEIRWPSGQAQAIADVAAGSTVRCVEGEDPIVEPPAGR
ncbi:MAG: CRTAC1 family protein [bacterium]